MSEEQQKLVTDNINLIFYYMHKNHIPLEDKDIGYVALCKAASTFKPETGFKFTTYAMICIRNEFAMQLRVKKREPYTPVSLDDILYNDGEGGEITIGDSISGNYYTGTSPSLDEVYLNFGEYLSKLSPVHQEIIKGHIKGLTQGEISKITGQSQANISRVIKNIQRRFKERYYRELSVSEIIDNIKEELYGKDNRS